MFAKIKEIFSSFSHKEIIFFLSAMACGFLICADYAIIRPASNSLFIESYTAKGFPYAWIVAVPINFLVVFLYNRFLPKFGIFRMFLLIGALIGCGNAFLAFFIKEAPSLAFSFYIWKEIYVMLMLQQLWSVVHATLDLKRAKYLYGILFGIGGLGGVCGSFIPGFFAILFGSENLLFFSLPIYTVLSFFFFHLLKNSTMPPLVFSETKVAFSALKNIRTSPILLFILLTVVLMQTSSTLIDFQFNAYLEKIFPVQDLRTQYVGRVMGLVNLATIFLQFVGSLLFVRFLGLQKSHFTIPLLLGFNAVAFLISPVFGLITFSFGMIKSFDFSVFGILKEMLYIPLKVDEKFRAKAFIDVFAYRSAKAFASIFILLVQALLGLYFLKALTCGLIFMCGFWAVAAWRFFTKNPIEQEG